MGRRLYLIGLNIVQHPSQRKTFKFVPSPRYTQHNRLCRRQFSQFPQNDCLINHIGFLFHLRPRFAGKHEPSAESDLPTDGTRSQWWCRRKIDRSCVEIDAPRFECLDSEAKLIITLGKAACHGRRWGLLPWDRNCASRALRGFVVCQPAVDQYVTCFISRTNTHEQIFPQTFANTNIQRGKPSYAIAVGNIISTSRAGSPTLCSYIGGNVARELNHFVMNGSCVCWIRNRWVFLVL